MNSANKANYPKSPTPSRKTDDLISKAFSASSKASFDTLCKDLAKYNFLAIPEFIEIKVNREFSPRTAQIFRRVWSQFFKVKGRDRNRRVRLNVRAIASELSCSIKTVRRSIEDLCEAGILTTLRESNDNGKEQMSTFLINADAFKKERQAARKRQAPSAASDEAAEAQKDKDSTTEADHAEPESSPSLSEGKEGDTSDLESQLATLLNNKPVFKESEGLATYQKESALFDFKTKQLKAKIEKAKNNQAPNPEKPISDKQKHSGPTDRPWQPPVDSKWRIRATVRYIAKITVVTNEKELEQSIWSWMNNGWGKDKTNSFDHALNVAIKLCREKRWARAA